MDYKALLGAAIAEAAGLQEDFAALLETPPDPAMGDYALPCFKLARTLRKSPPAIAAELAEKLALPAWVERTEVAGGYLNFFLDGQFFARTTLERVAAEGERYGAAPVGAGKTVVIDYSSINIAKPFHIGHLSTTAIGSALYKIYEFLGYRVVGVNHLGDWGTQFGKLICAYLRWGDDADIDARGVHAMLDLYVRFHEEAKQDEAMNEEARAWFKKIEEGDAQALAIFNRFKELTLREVGKIYDLLQVKFDSYAGESFYNDKMQPVIDELREKNLLEYSDGAYVVRLDDAGLPPCIVLKSDGATLYATRDLAAAFYRKQTYDFYKSLYVVAYQQNLHFQQIFEVVRRMGYAWADDMEHVAFGMVSLTEGTLSTREGRVVFLEDVLKQAIEKTTAIIAEKSPDLPDREAVAQAVGVGAVLFSALSVNRIKDITFDWERVLNFDGETAPYVQYTHARACSLQRKAGSGFDAAPDYAALACPQAQAVLRLIDDFGGCVLRAHEKNEPYLITRHVIALAQAFNKFYYDIRVVDAADPAGTAARLALTAAAARVIKTGLGLLGVQAPERM